MLEQITGGCDTDRNNGAAGRQLRPIEEIAPQGQKTLDDRYRVAVESTQTLQHGLADGVEGGHDELALVSALTGIVASAAGDPTLTERTWVLLTEAPEGGWGLAGHADTNAEPVAAARAQIAALQSPSV